MSNIQVELFFKKFPEPFIWNKTVTDSVTDTNFICYFDKKVIPNVNSVQEMTKYCLTEEFVAKCAKLAEDMDKMFNFRVPPQLKAFALCYCVKKKKQLLNWNAMLCHLENVEY